MKTRVFKAKDEHRRFEERLFSGDCLEAVGIPTMGYVLIDRLVDFKVGDLVWCNKHAGSLNTYIKQVFEVGDIVHVGTRYNDTERDFSFDAQEILGVVVCCMDKDRKIVWEREVKA